MDSYQKLYDALEKMGTSGKNITVKIYDQTEFETKKTDEKIKDAPELLTKEDLIKELDVRDPDGKGITFDNPR